MKNPYSVLNIDIHADQQTIKNAFRTLAKQYHPDVNNGSKEAERKFIEITEAYNILSDPNAKREVDAILNNSNTTNRSEEFNYNYTYNQKYTAEDINLLIKLFHQQAAPYKQQALTALLKGLGWLALGILVTWFSYSMADQTGGRYMVFWGAIVFGGWQAIKAFWAYSKINEAINDFEEEMWSEI